MRSTVQKVINAAVGTLRRVAPRLCWRAGYVPRIHCSTEMWASSVMAGQEICPPQAGFVRVNMPPCRTDRSTESIRCLTPDKGVDFSRFLYAPASVSSLFVAGIPSGRVFGRNGFVLDGGGSVMGDVPQVLTTGFAGEHPLSFRRLPPKIRRLDGVSATLAVFSVSNYYHWLYDALPRLAILREAGIDWDGIDQFVVTRDSHGFVQATLASFGIAPERLVAANDEEVLECDYLVVPSMPALGDRSAPDWMVGFLREMMPQHADGAGELKIFVARKPGTRRSLDNMSEIECVLAEAGFTTVFPEDLGFAGQRDLFSRARSIIGIHGAALTNIVFCQPGARVLEIFSPGYVNPCYAPLAARAGANYAYVVGEGGGGQTALQIANVGKSICLDPSKLRKLMKDFFND